LATVVQDYGQGHGVPGSFKQTPAKGGKQLNSTRAVKPRQARASVWAVCGVRQGQAPRSLQPV